MGWCLCTIYWKFSATITINPRNLQLLLAKRILTSNYAIVNASDDIQIEPVHPLRSCFGCTENTKINCTGDNTGCSSLKTVGG
jgi:hypothetical protein